LPALWHAEQPVRPWIVIMLVWWQELPAEQPVAATVWFEYFGCVAAFVIAGWHPDVPQTSVRGGFPVAWHAAHLLAVALWITATLPLAWQSAEMHDGFEDTWLFCVAWYGCAEPAPWQVPWVHEPVHVVVPPSAVLMPGWHAPHAPAAVWTVLRSVDGWHVTHVTVPTLAPAMVKLAEVIVAVWTVVKSACAAWHVEHTSEAGWPWGLLWQSAQPP
jgi:hypothetical protein